MHYDKPRHVKFLIGPPQAITADLALNEDTAEWVKDNCIIVSTAPNIRAPEWICTSLSVKGPPWSTVCGDPGFSERLHIKSNLDSRYQLYSDASFFNNEALKLLVHQPFPDYPFEIELDAFALNPGKQKSDMAAKYAVLKADTDYTLYSGLPIAPPQKLPITSMRYQNDNIRLIYVHPVGFKRIIPVKFASCQ